METELDIIVAALLADPRFEHPQNAGALIEEYGDAAWYHACTRWTERKLSIRPCDPILANSNEVLDVVLGNRDYMSRGAWLKQLGEQWTRCDNLWTRRAELRQVLRTCTREELALLMTPEERAALAKLPARLEVWRGCYPRNRSGLSWSLSREVAARFPTQARYRGPIGELPLLRRGFAQRDRVILKLDRNEAEIVAATVFGITEFELPVTD